MEHTIWTLVHVKHFKDLFVPILHEFFAELDAPFPPLTEVQLIEKFAPADQMRKRCSIAFGERGKVGRQGVSRELSKTFLRGKSAGVHPLEG
jgi:hypothetical protein